MKHLVAALRHPRDYEWRRLRPFREHSQVLLGVGTLYVAYGSVLIWQAPTADRQRGLALGLALLPLWAWGVIFVVTGLLGILSSRWPPASETWGYAALSGMAWCWCAVYGVGMLLTALADFTGWGAQVAPYSAVSGFLIWLTIGFVWTRIAKLVNPADVHDIVQERARVLLVTGSTTSDEK